MNQRGFTLIELIVVLVVIGVAAVVLLIQRNDLQASFRDSERKTAINAMYYNLEEVFYRDNGYYPTTISEENLTAMDPELFYDMDDYLINTAESSYHYEASRCDGNECQAYRLSATLEREATYERTNQNRQED